MKSNDSVFFEAITEIANSELILKKLEPNLFSHNKIKINETQRVLTAYYLFQKELEK